MNEMDEMDWEEKRKQEYAENHWKLEEQELIRLKYLMKTWYHVVYLKDTLNIIEKWNITRGELKKEEIEKWILWWKKGLCFADGKMFWESKHAKDIWNEPLAGTNMKEK